MSNEFCVKCSEKDAEIELLRKQLFDAQQTNERMRRHNDALIMDVAFYDKKFPFTNGE